MTDNTELIDEVIHEQLIMVSSFSTDDQAKIDMAVAKSKIKALIAKEVAKATTPTHIMGKPIDEVIMILNALELERIEDMKMTMANLDEWLVRVREDYRQATDKALNHTIQTTLNGVKNKSQGDK